MVLYMKHSIHWWRSRKAGRSRRLRSVLCSILIGTFMPTSLSANDNETLEGLYTYNKFAQYN